MSELALFKMTQVLEGPVWAMMSALWSPDDVVKLCTSAK